MHTIYQYVPDMDVVDVPSDFLSKEFVRKMLFIDVPPTFQISVDYLENDPEKRP